MKVLELSVHFPPNVGGVETHLWDLVTYLKKNWQVVILCYQPLSAKISWKVFEKSENLKIFRIPWISGLFYKFIPYPKLEFLYLLPGLFIFTPVILFSENPNIIHAHGLVAGFVGVLWGKIFGKKVIISTHSLYSFPKSGLYLSFAKFIFGEADSILCLSNKSCQEILSLGINKTKIKQFTYWIDLNKFKKVNNAKSRVKEKFSVLFVGRLVSEKGIEVLLESTKKWNKNIGLIFAGTGPLEKLIKKEAAINSRIHFLGRINQEDLASLYSSVDLTIVPSTSEEGFGRVIMESLACGTPVVASSKGSIPEVMDESVGLLINISPQNIKNSVEGFYKNPTKLDSLSKNTRKFAEGRYSDKNAETIIQTLR